MDKLKLLLTKFLQDKKAKYKIIGGVVVILLVLIALTPTQSTQDQIGANITPTEDVARFEAQLPGDYVEEKTAVESEPLEFSEDNHISEYPSENLGNGLIKYMPESENPNRSDIVLVKDESAIIFTRRAVVGATSDNYKQLLKRPHETIAGPTFYGPSTVIYFYATGGTALIVNPLTDTTYEEFTFQPPISLEEFNSTYKKYVQADPKLVTPTDTESDAIEDGPDYYDF